jgi:uncharacterized protein YbjQ (UPF0145 family)
LYVDPLIANQSFSRTIALAKGYKLSSYDAAYLEPALRQGLPITTLDKNFTKLEKFMSLFGLFGSRVPSESASLIEGCTTLTQIPGKEIIKSLGLIEYTKKDIAGDAPKISSGIFESLLIAAQEKGANAVVNVRLMSGSYQTHGSKLQLTYVIAYGDAVVVN